MECRACISVQMLPWPQTLLLPRYVQLQHFKNSDTFSFNVCWVKWRLERRMNDTHTAKNIRLTSNTKLQTLHSPSLKYWTAQELSFLSASPPSETTSVTTRWRPPCLRTSNDRLSPKASSNSHAHTPLPSHLYLKFGPATYHIKIKIKTLIIIIL